METVFKGYGVLRIKDGTFKVSSLRNLNPLRCSLDSLDEDTVLDTQYELNYRLGLQLPGYAQGQDGMLVPVLKNVEAGVLYIERENGTHSDVMMVRNWGEFEEGRDSSQRFEDYLAKCRNGACTVSPMFEVHGRRLLIEDQGFLYGRFEWDGDKYMARSIVKSRFLVDDKQTELFYVGGKNWSSLPSFDGENFSLIDMNRSYDTTWESYSKGRNWQTVFPPRDMNFGGSFFDGTMPPVVDKEFCYDGKNHRPQISSRDYTVSYDPDCDWVDVGEYKIVCKLASGKKWVGGKTDDFVRTIKIIHGKNSWEIEPSMDKRDWVEGETPGRIQAKAKLGPCKVIYDGGSSEMPTTVGKHIATVTVEAGQGVSPLQPVELEFEIKLLNPELQFLGRFSEYVAKCGFRYDERDLVRFHTCVKTGMMTLLGGDPGCGKSSLVELYARSLAGKEWSGASLKQIDVNPAWMEPADLMGYSSPCVSDFKSDGDAFHEAQCALRRFLRDLVETESGKEAELGKRSPAFVCFEEMNLARIELYFSDFIQMISRYELTSQSKQLSSYGGEHGRAPLKIPCDVRFVGTCNDDSTVKPMSDRFLDRANLILLGRQKAMYKDGDNEKESSVGKGAALFSSVKGRMKRSEDREVCADEYVGWIKEPQEEDAEKSGRRLDEIYSGIGAAFESLSISPSPRVCGEILRYVINRPSKPNVDEDVALYVAFDEALVQRVVGRCLPNALLKGKYAKAAEAVRAVFDEKLKSVDLESLVAERLDALERQTEQLFQWANTDVD